jgi:1-acyl-sn-glycerol-3-phosphate acyltransferase
MLRGILVLATFLVLTPILGLTAVLWTWIDPASDAILRVGAIWSRAHLTVAGCRLSSAGRDNVPDNGPCILLCNHASVVDIWAMLLLSPPRTRFVAKDELFRMPFLGWALRVSGFVPIDRSNRERAVASLKQAAATVEAGQSILMFPEGTRSRDGRLLPFKRGAFHLALEAGVPVVPVTILGSFDRIPRTRFRARPGPVEVVFDRPIDVTPYRPADVRGLSDRVREVLARRLGEVPAAGDGYAPAPDAAAPAEAERGGS